MLSPVAWQYYWQEWVWGYKGREGGSSLLIISSLIPCLTCPVIQLLHLRPPIFVEIVSFGSFIIRVWMPLPFKPCGWLSIGLLSCLNVLGLANARHVEDVHLIVWPFSFRSQYLKGARWWKMKDKNGEMSRKLKVQVRQFLRTDRVHKWCMQCGANTFLALLQGFSTMKLLKI